MRCQVCSSQSLEEVIDLGHHPPSDSFLSADELNEKETFYPLKAFICNDCKLVQLNYAVDPHVLFTDKFIFMTGHNRQLKAHFQQLVGDLVRRYNVKDGDLAVDIGSNDGTLLSFYPKGVRVLGIDPSNIADIANRGGIKTLKEFFNEDLAKRLVKEYGKAKIITCTNTFAHVKELSSLMNGIKTLLADDGVFVQESHYLLDMVQKLQHDEIYLEHLRYYSVESLINLFKHHDLELFHAERIESHGGSIRTDSSFKGSYPINSSVKTLLQQEAEAELNSKPTLLTFRARAYQNRLQLIGLMNELKQTGKRVAGIGAAAKGMSLLNFCKIGSETIDFIAETNQLKVGKFSPGTHIPVVDESVLFKEQPEYALLLAWNIKDILIPKLKEKGYRGKFILPNPTVEVVQ